MVTQFLKKCIIPPIFEEVHNCDDICYAVMMFGRMHTRKWDPGILFPNGMDWRALLIVGVQCKQWDPGIVFNPLDFKFFGKQSVWEMDSPFNKVILIRVVQQ